MAIDSHSD